VAPRTHNNLRTTIYFYPGDLSFYLKPFELPEAVES
jgi:hypothetical protein